MAQVTIGPEFFSKAKRDYSDWRWALVREFMQNSIDCGSKTIHFDVAINRDGDTVLTVTNDGEPMTEDILVNKLLSLGSSGKDFQNGCVGGYGKAKELLYFCWKSYHIETGNHVVDGSGATYDIARRSARREGTLSCVVIPGDYVAELEREARRFVAYSQVRCRFSVNGGPLLSGGTRAGYYRRDLAGGRLYTNKQYKNILIVRVNGIPMFTEDIRYSGCVVLELQNASIASLTANRDGLPYTQRCELHSFIATIGTNQHKALGRPAVEYLRYDGPKVVCRGTNQEDRNPAETTAAMTDITSITSYSETNSDDNQMASSFVIRNETGRRVPTKWRPDSPKFSRYARDISNLWIRLIKTIHACFDLEGEFSTGFVFSDQAKAMCGISDKHGCTYYLNPVAIEGSKWTNRWRYSYWIADSRKDLHELTMIALHEVLHGMGYEDHDETFSTKLTEMAGRLLGYHSELIVAYRGK